MKKCFVKNKKYLEKCLKINLFIKNKLKINKKQLFFSKINFFCVKNVIFQKNKELCKGNFLIDVFK